MPIPTEKVPCPGCGHGLTYVVETRSETSTTGTLTTLRRRWCAQCSGRFTTRSDEHAISGSYAPRARPPIWFRLEITTSTSGRLFPDPS